MWCFTCPLTQKMFQNSWRMAHFQQKALNFLRMNTSICFPEKYKLFYCCFCQYWRGDKSMQEWIRSFSGSQKKFINLLISCWGVTLSVPQDFQEISDGHSHIDFNRPALKKLLQNQQVRGKIPQIICCFGGCFFICLGFGAGWFLVFFLIFPLEHLSAAIPENFVPRQLKITQSLYYKRICREPGG